MTADRGGRHFGVTVMPEYLQSEGVTAVLDRLGALGVTAIVTSPYVAAECGPGEGGREPPIDAGAGDVRLLDRPLWGKRELYLRTEPSFEPDRPRYKGIPYQPPEPGVLTAREGGFLDDLIAEAGRRGIEVYLQIMAAIPPCYRVQFGGPHPEDMPLLPDGSPVPARVDNNASLAASGVRAYLEALIADLCRRYPGIAGIKLDWPEYPPYEFLSLFADFNPQVAPYAAATGVDFDRLKGGMAQMLEDLTRGNWGGPDLPSDWPAFIEEMAARWPQLSDHLALRRHLVRSHAAFLGEAVKSSGGEDMQMVLQGFPPPWSELSGFDCVALELLCDRLAVKFYTMHWPMMLANYAGRLSGGCPDPGRLANHLGSLLVGDGLAEATGLAYPPPERPHHVSAEVIAAKYRMAAEGLRTPPIFLAHGYGPIEDVVMRFRAGYLASGGRIELNRYCYLSDAKLAALQACLGELSS